ncbi:MAG: hypothetical protein JWP07_2889 [Pseudonocardiales bacterium]|nr:hypothetical protein [Pseudonocardiales bacterium]
MTGPGGDVVRIEHGPCAPRELRNGGWTSFHLAGPAGGEHRTSRLREVPPGSVTQLVAHDAEELYYIVRGSADAGSIRQDFAQCN